MNIFSNSTIQFIITSSITLLLGGINLWLLLRRRVQVPLEDEKILLAFPLLDSNDVITIRVLITGRIDYFPDISVRVPGSKRIVRANNIQQSKELFITALYYYLLVRFHMVIITLPFFSRNMGGVLRRSNIASTHKLAY